MCRHWKPWFCQTGSFPLRTISPLLSRHGKKEKCTKNILNKSSNGLVKGDPATKPQVSPKSSYGRNRVSQSYLSQERRASRVFALSGLAIQNATGLNWHLFVESAREAWCSLCRQKVHPALNGSKRELRCNHEPRIVSCRRCDRIESSLSTRILDDREGRERKEWR